MDDLDIILSCCLSTTKYKHLKDLNGTTKCFICKDGEFNVQECLKKATNAFTIKKRQIELEMKSLNEAKNIYNDPKNIIDESFQGIISDIDLRREILKSNLNSKIDEKSSILTKRIKSDNIKLEANFKELLAELETLDISSLMKEIESQETLYEKIQCLETNLIMVNNKQKRLDDFLNEAKIGKTLKIFFNDNFDIDKMFGTITSYNENDFVTENDKLTQENEMLKQNLEDECELRNQILNY